VGLGVIFLIQSYLGTEIRNWWALFILIPAFFTLERGYSSVRAGDTPAATGQIIGGLVLVALVVIFLLDIPFGRIWPVFLIIAGIAMLLSRRGWRLGP
jgi:hypothetical protein